jgi:hypothetical protein
LNGKDPEAFIMSKNDKRHHMTSGQRAMIAAMVRDMRNRKALLSYMAKHPDLSEAEAKQALANAAKTKKSQRKDDDNSVVIISDRDTAEQTSVSRELIRKAALVIEYERELVEHVMAGLAQSITGTITEPAKSPNSLLTSKRSQLPNGGSGLSYEPRAKQLPQT